MLRPTTCLRTVEAYFSRIIQPVILPAPRSGSVRSGRAKLHLMALGMLPLLVLASCGGTPSAQSATSSAPATATAQSATPDASSTGEVTPEETDSFNPSEEPTSDSETPIEGESQKPPVLDKRASGRELTTADFFSTPENWRDGRFNVAGKQSLAGVAGPLEDCSEEPEYNSPTIELRLANNFSKISMRVGQSDDSRSSDTVVKVKILGNGAYLDSTQVAFNKIQRLDASVVGVNALKIQAWQTGEHCEGGSSVEAVLMELKVE